MTPPTPPEPPTTPDHPVQDWTSVYATAWRHTPAAMALGVSAHLTAQLALLVASWLPWKLLGLLAGGPLPPGWPITWSRPQTAVALAAATVAAYALYLAGGAGVARCARWGGVRLYEGAGKGGLFNQQERLAQRLYTHLLRSCGAAVFVLLSLGVLVSQRPLLAVVAVACVAAGVALFTRPLRRPQAVALGYGVAGLLLACGLLMATGATDDNGHLFLLLLLLILYRQLLAQTVEWVMHARQLWRRQREALALFVAHVPWRRPRLEPCAFRTLWTAESYLDVMAARYQAQWGQAPAPLRARLRKTARGQIAEWTLDNGGDSARGLLLRVFSPAREAQAAQERGLLVQEGNRLPAHTWLGAHRQGGMAWHHFAWSAAWTPVPDGQRRLAHRQLRTALLAHEPGPATQASYLQGRTTWPQRLLPDVLAALRPETFDAGQASALDALLSDWPALLARLAALPLRVTLPQLGLRPLVRDEQGQLRLFDWTRWRLEPAGAGWPVSPHLRDELAAALAPLAALDLDLDLVELSAHLHELDQRLEGHDTTGALALLPHIADLAQALLARGAPQRLVA